MNTETGFNPTADQETVLLTGIADIDLNNLLMLYSDLKEAYWYASDINDKDLLTAAANSIIDLITKINQNDILSREKAFALLGQELSSSINILQKVQADITSLVKEINMANKLLGSLGKFLAFFA